ncbi:MAG: inorganic diphosphatase [Candidatus Nomurabacteria bacterium]|jgi:inorganic pyrophosphatase|nr:inorganic diphosphatase [Candidatus Nomurabacteria bacterium]
MDWNQVLDTGDVDAGEINVVIEIPKGSNHKVEWNRRRKVFEIDRIEPSAFPKPTNYGFIPQTLDEDGDELDALIITNGQLPMNTFLKVRVLGVMKFTDDGEIDDKIVCVPIDDRDGGNSIKTLADVPKQLLNQIEYHFNHYKDLKKPGTTKVESWGDIEEAKTVIRESQARWANQ